MEARKKKEKKKKPYNGLDHLECTGSKKGAGLDDSTLFVLLTACKTFTCSYLFRAFLSDVSL